MASIASIQDGKVQNASQPDSLQKNASLDKDAFLQLLVTQMKYQDPLEPTDNTEYVSQLATFSSLEEMQNIAASSDLSRATSLVGKYVTVNSTSATGEQKLIGGKVDYVAVENNKAYLNINGENYSVDDLDSVVDEAYLTAYNIANDFAASMSKLPSVANLTEEYSEVIENLRTVYDDLDSYQQSFIGMERVKLLEAYEERLAQLRATGENADETETTEEVDGE